MFVQRIQLEASNRLDEQCFYVFMALHRRLPQCAAGSSASCCRMVLFQLGLRISTSSDQLVWLIKHWPPVLYALTFDDTPLCRMSILPSFLPEEEKNERNAFNIEAGSWNLSPQLQPWQSEVENWPCCDTPHHHTTMCGWNAALQEEKHKHCRDDVIKTPQSLTESSSATKSCSHVLCHTLEEVQQILFRPKARRRGLYSNAAQITLKLYLETQ